MLPRQRNELVRSLWDLLEKRLDPAAAARLESQLCDSPQARQVYVAFLDLTASLRWRQSLDPEQAALARRMAAELPVPGVRARSQVAGAARPTQRTRSWWISIAPKFAAAGLCALLVTYFASLVILVSLRQQPATSIVEPNDSGSVGMITNAVDVRRLAHSPESSDKKIPVPFSPGDAITRGEPLSITAGFVELKLKQGVTLLIEGPATWTIDGQNHAALKHGRLVAQVPTQAIGFTLDTPTAKIVDLGTEFGVQVGNSGRTELQMLVGSVDVVTVTAASGQQPRRLLAGQAVSIGRPSPTAPIAVESIPFDAAGYQFRSKLAAAPRSNVDDGLLLVSQGKPVTSASSYAERGYTFSASAVTDGRLRDVDAADDSTYWVAKDGSPAADLVVDLLGVYDLAEIRLQPTHNGQWHDRGTKDFRVSVSADGNKYVEVVSGSLRCAFHVDSPPLERYLLKSPIAGRFVKFEALSCYGQSPGLNEIQIFAGEAATPASPAIQHDPSISR